MERMIVVIFDEESKAREAFEIMNELDASDDVSVYALAVIKKNMNGNVSIEESSNVFPAGEITGTAIGTLIGLLSESPIIGGAGGAVAGSVIDMERAGVNVEFIGEVSEKLKPGKFATVADISEESTAPVDNQMKKLGGYVFRVDWQKIENEQDTREVESIEREEKELDKLEKSEERVEKRAELRERLHNKLEEIKMKIEERNKEIKAKNKHLEEKLANARGNTKRRIEGRIDSLKKHSEQSQQQPAAPQQQAQNS
jgi:uncharacterized membrane protein